MFAFNGKIAVQYSDEVRREQCLVLLLVSLSRSGKPIKSFRIIGCVSREKKNSILQMEVEDAWNS